MVCQSQVDETSSPFPMPSARCVSFPHCALQREGRARLVRIGGSATHGR